MPPAWHYTDPLVLAVDRNDIEFATLLLPVRSERKCPGGRVHPLFQDAWSHVLSAHQDALVEPMLREAAVPDQTRQIELAQQLHRAGYDGLAANFFFGPQRVDETLPLAAAARVCNVKDTAFWLAETRRRGRQQDVDLAWDLFNRAVGWRDARACTSTMALFADAGSRIPAGFAALALRGGRRHGGATATWRRVAPARRSRGRRRNRSSPSSAAPAATRRRRPRASACPRPTASCPSSARRRRLRSGGPTVFRDLLPPPRPLAERYVYDAAHSTLMAPFDLPIREAKAKGCLAALDDPAILSHHRFLPGAARGAPVHREIRLGRAGPRCVSGPDIAAPDRDRQLAVCQARHAQPIIFE